MNDRCPKCGAYFSIHARQCPNCGNMEHDVKSKDVPVAVLRLVLIVVLINFLKLDFMETIALDSILGFFAGFFV